MRIAEQLVNEYEEYSQEVQDSDTANEWMAKRLGEFALSHKQVNGFDAYTFSDNSKLKINAVMMLIS